MVGVETVDVVADHSNRPLNVLRTVPAAPRAVDVTRDGDACPGVVRVAVRRLRRGRPPRAGARRGRRGRDPRLSRRDRRRDGDRRRPPGAGHLRGEGLPTGRRPRGRPRNGRFPRDRRLLHRGLRQWHFRDRRTGGHRSTRLGARRCLRHVKGLSPRCLLRWCLRDLDARQRRGVRLSAGAQERRRGGDDREKSCPSRMIAKPGYMPVTHPDLHDDDLTTPTLASVGYLRSYDELLLLSLSRPPSGIPRSPDTFLIGHPSSVDHGKKRHTARETTCLPCCRPERTPTRTTHLPCSVRSGASRVSR
jgi:hypothetical protein